MISDFGIKIVYSSSAARSFPRAKAVMVSVIHVADRDNAAHLVVFIKYREIAEIVFTHYVHAGFH